jgi:hypothetical protein
MIITINHIKIIFNISVSLEPYKLGSSLSSFETGRLSSHSIKTSKSKVKYDKLIYPKGMLLCPLRSNSSGSYFTDWWFSVQYRYGDQVEYNNFLEDVYLLQCDVMHCVRSLSKLRRNILTPYSMTKTRPNKQAALLVFCLFSVPESGINTFLRNFYHTTHTTRSHISETLLFTHHRENLWSHSNSFMFSSFCSFSPSPPSTCFYFIYAPPPLPYPFFFFFSLLFPYLKKR